MKERVNFGLNSLSLDDALPSVEPETVGAAPVEQIGLSDQF